MRGESPSYTAYFDYHASMDHSMIIAENEADFRDRGASLLSASIRKAILDRGRAIVGLSGGSTPKPIYETLGEDTAIDWSQVWVFLVDDRYIQKDDPRSNQFLLRSTLLRHAPIPESQIVVPDITLPYSECIALYEKHLQTLLQKGPSDIVTLGLGKDGHIASLFPPVPKEAFSEKLAIGTATDRFDVRQRISVTMKVLTSARETVFFLKGAEKKKTWDEMQSSSEGQERWPGKSVLHKATALAWW